MKRVATDKDPTVTGIPAIARITVIGVQPTSVVVTIHVEHAQIAVGVHYVQDAAWNTAP